MSVSVREGVRHGFLDFYIKDLKMISNKKIDVRAALKTDSNGFVTGLCSQKATQIAPAQEHESSHQVFRSGVVTQLRLRVFFLLRPLMRQVSYWRFRGEACAKESAKSREGH